MKEIFLPEFPTLVCTVQRNKDRQKRIIETMGKLGFKNWKFIYIREAPIGKNYITNIVDVPVGNKVEKWIQFKVPVREPQKIINGISDFRSIRFMRMFLKDFNEEVIVRFARLEFIRGEWRKYLGDLNLPGETFQTDPNLTTFNISAVNFEENAARTPVNYPILSKR
jgi:cell surface protein SprA